MEKILLEIQIIEGVPKRVEENKMKNMVVLKNLPSNIVEEAFVILKSNINIKEYQMNTVEKKKEKGKKEDNITIAKEDYIVKEAEAVVASYISKMERPKELEKKNKKLMQKYKRLEKLTAFFAIIAVFGIVVNLL